MDSGTMSGGVPDDPADFTPAAAVSRFLRKRQTDATDRTLRSYQSRLERFIEWCQDTGIERVGDLTAFHVDEYDLFVREGDREPATVKGHLSTLRVFLGYCADIGAVDEDLPESVSVPTLDRSQESSEERLAPEDAKRALSFFRDSARYRGTPWHAWLELAWNTGARMGSLRGLDLDDYHPEEQYVEFVHRPATDTPLKNKADGERAVGLNEQVCDALDLYIARERSDKRDEHGRQPLFCGRQGRPSFSTLRAWSYQATEPCLWTDCPHGKRRASCEWTERAHASKCPSSRSPHRIRTGSITWQLNQGLGIETVSTRVNASARVIKKFYDAATQQEEFNERRREVETALDISTEEDTE